MLYYRIFDFSLFFSSLVFGFERKNKSAIHVFSFTFHAQFSNFQTQKNHQNQNQPSASLRRPPPATTTWSPPPPPLSPLSAAPPASAAAAAAIASAASSLSSSSSGFADTEYGKRAQVIGEKICNN